MSEPPKPYEKDVFADVDGYFYYWVEGRGSLSAASLREIADHLDQINKPWDEQVNKMMASIALREVRLE